MPFPNEVVVSFFAHLMSPAEKRKLLRGREDIKDDSVAVEPFSHSHIVGFRSALADLYRMHKISLPPETDKDLKDMLDGYEKLCNQLMRRGLMRVQQGKRELRLGGYFILCKKFMCLQPEARHGSWSTSIFAWCYFVLMWNLGSRPESVEALMLERISWAEDCLTIDEQVIIYGIISE